MNSLILRLFSYILKATNAGNRFDNDALVKILSSPEWRTKNICIAKEGNNYQMLGVRELCLISSLNRK